MRTRAVILCRSGRQKTWTVREIQENLKFSLVSCFARHWTPPSLQGTVICAGCTEPHRELLDAFRRPGPPGLICTPALVASNHSFESCPISDNQSQRIICIWRVSAGFPLKDKTIHHHHCLVVHSELHTVILKGLCSLFMSRTWK